MQYSKVLKREQTIRNREIGGRDQNGGDRREPRDTKSRLGHKWDFFEPCQSRPLQATVSSQDMRMVGGPLLIGIFRCKSLGEKKETS